MEAQFWLNLSILPTKHQEDEDRIVKTKIVRNVVIVVVMAASLALSAQAADKTQHPGDLG